MRKFYSTAADRIGETSSSLAGAAASSMFSGTIPAGVSITGQQTHDVLTIRHLTGLPLHEAKEIVAKIYAAQDKKYARLDADLLDVLKRAIRSDWSETEIRARFEKVLSTVIPF
jgi:hypothetical protein